MMAAVAARGTTVIDNAAREPEIADTAALLTAMGARVGGAGTSTLEIDGVDAFTPTEHRTIPDRIEAGTWVAAAVATRGDVTIEDARGDHLDLLLSKLTDAGAEIERTEDGIRVRQDDRPTAVDFVTLPYPGLATDFQPILMAALAVARGTSIATENVFESRFLYVDELRRMGAEIRTEGHHAVIRGVERLSAAPVRALDIRAGAAMVIAGLCADGVTEIADLQHIDRGYEALEAKLTALGAEVRREGEAFDPARPRGDPVTGEPEAGIREPTTVGTGPRGLPAVTFQWWEAMLAYIVGNLLLGGLAYAATGAGEGAPPERLVVGAVALDLVFLGSLVVWLRNVHPGSWAAIGLAWRTRAVAAGAALGALVYPVAVGGAGLVLQWLYERVAGHPVEAPEQMPGGLSDGGTILFVVLAVGIAPVIEELFFRGIFYRSLRDRYGIARRPRRLGGAVRSGPFPGGTARRFAAAAVGHGPHRRRSGVDLRVRGDAARQHRGAHGLQRDRRDPDPAVVNRGPAYPVRTVARFPTQEWFDAFVVEINASDEYRVAAAEWEGDIAFLIQAEPDKGVPADVWGWLDLQRGRCLGGGVVDEDRAATAAYTITAPYTRWKDVLQDELDPIKGMMQGKLKVRGDLPTIVRQVRAATELVRLTGLVRTEFPDEG